MFVPEKEDVAAEDSEVSGRSMERKAQSAAQVRDIPVCVVRVCGVCGVWCMYMVCGAAQWVYVCGVGVWVWVASLL